MSVSGSRRPAAALSSRSGMVRLAEIPYFEATPLELLRLAPGRAKDLAYAAEGTFGALSRAAAVLGMRFADGASRAWLARAANPFLPEIDMMAAMLGIRGVHTLNVCLEWGCTSGIWPTADGPILRRVLDWSFPHLGENLVVAGYDAPGGKVINITWPGLAGSFQALAPGRFAVAINQAPMRRHAAGFLGDWLFNRLAMTHKRGLPPAHLLRQICETAADYGEAKTRFCRTEIAVPAIFVLAGTGHRQGCVIERTETEFAVREMAEGSVSAANHFEILDGLWRPRPIDSAGRAACARTLTCEQPDLSWFRPPIANANSRLAFEACAANGRLNLVGTHGVTAATELFALPA